MELHKSNFTIFTVCNLAYLPKALVLGDTVYQHNSTKLKIFLFDTKRAIDLVSINADIFWIEDMNVPDLKKLAFKYDITEFSTSLKPWLAIYLLKLYDKVIFLDPDICLYRSVDEILNDLELYPIVLTPHYTTPQPNDQPNSDLGMMRFGSFNLGFFGIKKNEEGLSFLNWLSQRCITNCYFEPQFGLSTDQKWVTIAPCFFKNLYVSFHLGYNVAFWNIHERVISEDNNGDYIVNGKYPLVFFHFSNFDENNPDDLSKREFSQKMEKRPDLTNLTNHYAKLLISKRNIIVDTKYGYDYMSGGEYISPTLRRAYASIIDKLPNPHDPFDSNGIVGKFAKRNHLLETSKKIYVSYSFGNIKKHKYKFIAINFCMRLILMLIGPNNFFNFSRLLVYLSSYRQNSGLWKIDRLIKK